MKTKVLIMPPFSPVESLCFFSGENTVPTFLVEQALQPAPQAVKRKKDKKGKKGEKVGLVKPIGTGL